MKHFFLLVLAVCVSVGLFVPAHAAYFSEDDTITLAQDVNDDVFATGERIAIQAPVTGDIFAVGNSISIQHKPDRSIFGAANTVTIEEGSGYNAFVAGNTVTLKGTIEHDVYVAGQNVTIDPSAHIKGTLRVFGQDVTLNGQVDGDVFVSGQSLTSNASIGGSLTANTHAISFSGGKIGRDFHYSSNEEAQGISKVTIGGETKRTPVKDTTTTTETRVRHALIAFLTTLVTGAALLLLFPRKVKAVSEDVRLHWGQSLLYGVITLIVTPILATLVMVTVVGLPIGLIAWALYLVTLYTASILSMIFIGYWLLGLAKVRGGNWWLSLIVGSLIVTVVRFIPIIGSIAAIALFIGVILPTIGAELLWWKKVITEK